jgi:hypothetical protein
MPELVRYHLGAVASPERVHGVGVTGVVHGEAGEIDRRLRFQVGIMGHAVRDALKETDGGERAGQRLEAEPRPILDPNDAVPPRRFATPDVNGVFPPIYVIIGNR